MITFSYAEVLDVLAEVNRIAPDQLGAFRARLRNLQSKAFPPGTNTGKGKAARYTLENLFQMVVATQLMQIGMNPERIVATVTANWYPIALGLSRAMGQHEIISDQGDLQPTGDFVLALYPEALRDLTSAGERGTDYFDTVKVFLFSDIAEELPIDADSPSLGEAYRTVLIRLKAICRATLHAVASRAGAAPSDVEEEFSDAVLEQTKEAARNNATFRRMADAINKKA